MAPTCPTAEGSAKVRTAARIASPARGRSGHSDLAIPHTAWATTATAATFNPWTAPEAATSLQRVMPYANAISAMAEGSVKPIQAINAPGQPARNKPSPMPTWLLAGPGRNWHRATRSE